MKICIIMPIYPPHFGYANEFINSFFKYEFDKQADLVFVFTDEKERKEFKNTNFKGYYKSLVLPKFLRVSAQRGITNIKKFFALLSLKDEYEYSLIIDSESEFVKNVDLLSLFDEFYAKKILYGNETRGDTSAIKSESKKLFEEKFLNQSFEGEELFLWFNQPCIYKNGFLDEFFKAIKIDTFKDLLLLNWHSFDYYVYMYFLIFYKDFEVVDLEVLATWGFLESPQGFEFKSQKSKQIPFYWSHPHLAKELLAEKIFLYMHKDRFKIKEILKQEVKQSVATMRVQNFLSYKLGQAMVLNSKNLWGYIRMPYVLSYIAELHKKEQKEYAERIKNNPSLKLPPLESYSDYKEALKYKKHLSYKLGEALIQANSVRGGGGEYLLICNSSKKCVS